MYHALIWLLVVEALGLIALPLCFSLFRRLPDRGLILSMPLALLLSSYLLWLLGLTHLVPNSRYTIIGILAVLALVGFLVLRRNSAELASFLRTNWAPLVAAQLVFIGLYILWLTVVSSAPAINHTEKPMDFAFINAILRSSHFPPEDPWLAGHSISYYYFGHFMVATLTKLTAIPSNVSYNLSIGLIPALVGAGAFSLVYNLVRLSGAHIKTAILFALAAPVLVVLIGNLEGVLEFVNARGWGSAGFWEWVSIKDLGVGQGGDPSFFPQDYLWWWRGTRVIDTVVDGASLDYTITEFPFFSFLLGDLHPHVFALPFLLLGLALALNLFMSPEKFGFTWLRRNYWEVLVITLSLGALAFINIWDFPVFLVLFVAVVLLKGYGDWDGQIQRSLLPSLSLLVPVVAGAVVLFLPFYLTLGSQASGLATVGEVSTRPLFFFLIWGLFLVIAGSFLLKQLATVPRLMTRNPGTMATVLVITLLPFLLWVGITLLVSPRDDGIVQDLGTVGSRLGKLLPALVIFGVALYSMILRVRFGADRLLAFSLLPLALAFYLLMGAELFRVVDLFGNRMNTVFKLYYQSWLLLAIASAYGLYYWYSRPMPALPEPLKGLGSSVGTPFTVSGKAVRYGWTALVAVLFLASIYYPVGAALDRAESGGTNTLDGLAFLRRGNSGEYDAIRWLRDEAPWGRIVEAVGDDYSEYGRISASTGLPTVLGWQGHEHQWRGSRKPFDGRKEQVAQLYRSDDPEQVRRLLETYDIRYVYVGARERSKYGNSQLHKFSSFLQPVRRFNDVVIYEHLQDVDQGDIEQDDGGAG